MRASKKLPDRERSATDATPPSRASAAGTERTTQRNAGRCRAGCEPYLDLSIGPRDRAGGGNRGAGRETVLNRPCFTVMGRRPRTTRRAREPGSMCAGTTLRDPATRASSGHGTTRRTPAGCNGRARGLGKVVHALAYAGASALAKTHAIAIALTHSVARAAVALAHVHVVAFPAARTGAPAVALAAVVLPYAPMVALTAARTTAPADALATIAPSGAHAVA